MYIPTVGAAQSSLISSAVPAQLGRRPAWKPAVQPITFTAHDSPGPETFASKERSGKWKSGRHFQAAVVAAGCSLGIRHHGLVAPSPPNSCPRLCISNSLRHNPYSPSRPPRTHPSSFFAASHGPPASNALRMTSSSLSPAPWLSPRKTGPLAAETTPEASKTERPDVLLCFVKK
ncbi:hypothetical protein CDD83_1584 [Cordyceps sp. RAO-2017]|nr:hypothetical protein CDD83_1584 [Cordyceps sp. RAO-2017]